MSDKLDLFFKGGYAVKVPTQELFNRLMQECIRRNETPLDMYTWQNHKSNTGVCMCDPIGTYKHNLVQYSDYDYFIERGYKLLGKLSVDYFEGKNKATELEFLEWFYLNADFGPADSDVRYYLKERFMRDKGKELPEGYELCEEDEDD